MSDPFYLADILLGRIGVLRSTTESVLLELCEVEQKLETSAQALPAPDSINNIPVHLGEGETSRAAIKNKLERIQTNLKLLKRLGPEFVAFENKLNAPEETIQSHRNLLLEYHWKYHVQEMGEKAQNVYLQGISRTFPRMERLGDRVCPPTPDPNFIPKSHKRLRMLDFQQKSPSCLTEMIEHMAQKNPKLRFGKDMVVMRGGQRVIRAIKCIVNGELVVYISFCPFLPESANSNETVDIQSVSNSEDRLSVREKSSRQNGSEVDRKLATPAMKNDMLSKVKLAAEEATKLEMEELQSRELESREQCKDHQLAIAAGLQVSKSVQRVSVFSIKEDSDSALSAWHESKHDIFKMLSLHARKAFNYFRKHSPELCFYHFFTWLGYHEKLYQTPCSACKRILSKENEEWLFMPPSFRDYGSGLAYHTKCIVTN